MAEARPQPDWNMLQMMQQRAMPQGMPPGMGRMPRGSQQRSLSNLSGWEGPQPGMGGMPPGMPPPPWMQGGGQPGMGGMPPGMPQQPGMGGLPPGMPPPPWMQGGEQPGMPPPPWMQGGGPPGMGGMPPGMGGMPPGMGGMPPGMPPPPWMQGGEQPGPYMAAMARGAGGIPQHGGLTEEELQRLRAGGPQPQGLPSGLPPWLTGGGGSMPIPQGMPQSGLGVGYRRRGLSELSGY
jgi:hypothetical protein